MLQSFRLKNCVVVDVIPGKESEFQGEMHKYCKVILNNQDVCTSIEAYVDEYSEELPTIDSVVSVYVRAQVDDQKKFPRLQFKVYGLNRVQK